MGEMETQLASLKAMVESGFDELRRARADDGRLHTQRHAENTVRLDAINGKVARAHERIGVVESVQAGFLKELDRFRDRVHAFAGALQRISQKPGNGKSVDERGENRHLTMRDVYVFACGFSLFYAIAKLFQWLP